MILFVQKIRATCVKSKYIKTSYLRFVVCGFRSMMYPANRIMGQLFRKRMK
jgi:hypothetical protein